MIVVKDLRRLLTAITVALSVILATPLSSTLTAEGAYRFTSVTQAYDTLTVYIEPAVEALYASCDPLGSKQPFVLYVASNSSARSLIQLYAEGDSYYNITLNFTAILPWQIRVGVITNNPKAYTSPLIESRGSAYFVQTGGTLPNEPTGPQVVNIIVQAKGVQKTSGPYNIRFPPPFNSLLVLLIAGLLAYTNVFAVTDAYFKNKLEGISTQRKLGIGILIILSVALIYWVYTTAAGAEQQG